ncbi:MAG TPA: tripartite tricarboxylate transporter substrate binding protein [Xanthobacteraceae bacterium]|jgi:tripartite-type tricarboxylate transporter receptor subunit TctC
MKLPRRKFLHLAAGAAVLPAASRFARADTYPSRAVHLIVGFPAGNASDTLARLMGQSLSERLGQQFVIENRPGAGSNVGAEIVVRAPPDGYTLLLVTPSNAINTSLYEKLNFNFIRDIAPVASVVSSPYVMAVNPSLPAQTVPEFLAYAKANPGKINMASTGIGTATHVFGVLFQMMSGISMVHVPYRGNFVPDLLGGQVQVVFAPITHLIEYVRTNRLRALAVTTAMRSEALPDVPAMAEFVPGYEASGWYGIAAPKPTSTEIIEKLNGEINAALADPKLKARLADLGSVAMQMTPAEFEKFIAAESQKWAKVIKAANIKPE